MILILIIQYCSQILKVFSPATNLATHQISFPGNWNFLILALTGTTHGGIQHCGSGLEAEYL